MFEKLRTKILVIFICILAICALASCGNSVDNSASYVETTIVLPDNSEGIMDLKLVDDDTILIATTSNGTRTGTLWKSLNNGNTWDRVINYTDVLGIDPDDKNVECIPHISNNGDMLCMVSTQVDKDTLAGYVECYIVTVEGDKEKVLVELPESSLSDGTYLGDGISIEGDILDNGDLLLSNTSGEMYIVNRETFQITDRIFREGDARFYYNGYSMDGNTFYGMGLKHNLRYDLESKEIVNSEEDSLNKVAKEYRYSQTAPIMTTKNGTHYTVSDDGIKMYKKEKASLIVAEKDMSIVPSDVYLNTIDLDKSGNIYLALNREGGAPMLLMYNLKNKIQEKDKGELEIYTLKKDDDIEKIVSYYKKEKKDTNITLTVGMDNNEIENDAIKKLNTKLLSGNGPDVIIFDGIDADNYIDGKLLKPIKEIDKELYIGDVINTFSSEGNIYAVPARAIIPICLGAKQICIADTEKEFTSAITENGIEVKEYSIADIIGYSYQVFLSDKLIENGEVNNEIIEEYLYDMNEIYKKYSKDEKIHILHIAMPPKDTTGILDMLIGSNSAGVDYIYEGNQMQLLQLLDGSSYSMAGQNNKVCYIPRIIMGISGTSKNIEEAEEFIDFVMSKKGQNISGANMGLPVNRDILEKKLEELKEDAMIIGDDQGDKAVTLKPISKSNISEFMENMENLKKPLKNDAIAMGIVMEYLEKYLNGEMDIDKAVESISKKLSLHMSE